MSAQLAFPHFDGATYNPQRDHARLAGGLQFTAAVLTTGNWYSLAQLKRGVESLAGDRLRSVSEAGISARLRDLRKEKFAAVRIERAADQGTHRYRVHPEDVERLEQWLRRTA